VLTSKYPDLELIQFVDGDCELTRAWSEVGPRALAADERLAAVCGYRNEAEPRRNVFHRAVEQEWHMGPVGEVDDFSGDVLVRRSWFERVGGYDPLAVAGEDTELSSRLRAAGGRIVRLDVVATVHDIRMDSGRQWWRRAQRGGYGAAAVAELHREGDRLFADQVRRMVLWGALAPTSGLLALPWTAVPVAAVGLRWLWSSARAARSVTNPAADRWDRLAWGVSCACAAIPGAVGVARYHLDRRRHHGPRLVEYR
jgi:GT2 family glycosyltransferase